MLLWFGMSAERVEAEFVLADAELEQLIRCRGGRKPRRGWRWVSPISSSARHSVASEATGPNSSA
jgi:hypothetical protein